MLKYFLEAGVGEKNTRSWSTTDRLRIAGHTISSISDLVSTHDFRSTWGDGTRCDGGTGDTARWLVAPGGKPISGDTPRPL